MADMKSRLSDRQVVVNAQDLDDLTELARLASDHLQRLDPALAASLRSVSAEVRARSVLEP